MSNKLKPCPFCGGETRIETCNDNGAFCVSCYRFYECGATQYWYDFEAEAIAAWNRRVDLEARDE